MEFTSEADMLNYCRETGRTYCKFTLKQADKDLGFFIVELYTDICPKTSENFLNLTRGTGKYRYKGSPIHRVVKAGFVQGGDVVDGTGKGQPAFHIPDESFAVKHDQPGLIGMANLDAPHTASSQFYITLSPLPWLDGKRVAFGRILTGLQTLRALEDLPVVQNERPIPDVIISESSVLYEP